MHVFLPALVLLGALNAPGESSDLAAALERAGENRVQLEAAIERAPEDERESLRWLIAHMPERDLRTLDAEFLLEHSSVAHRAWREAPWREGITRELFLDAILPYASVDERRDRWRADFHERFAPLVSDAKSPSEAAATLNRMIFSELGVKYSTQRPKANQSPYESIEAGLASCTGLSVLLIDACRSVGVPARFVGTPLWSDGSGNHSWVEIWDGNWRFTGAAEPTGSELDRAWFTGRTAKASRSDARNAIYATTWRRTPLLFPMVWAPTDDSVAAVDVTDRYTRSSVVVPEGHARVRFRAIEAKALQRVARRIEVVREGIVVFTAQTKDERFDANDHVEAILAIGDTLLLTVDGDGGRTLPFTVERDEQLVSVLLTAADGALELGEESSETSSTPVDALRDLIAASPDDLLASIEAATWSRESLSRADAESAAQLLRVAHAERIRERRAAEIEAKVLTDGDLSMPYAVRTFGEAPAGGHSLWISMHGGGGAAAAVNDRQWENQKKLYELDEGIYVAPRAPTNTWNLWHRDHIDRLFDRLIENMIAVEGVDPDRVYILGYSAGGDGVYQLAPRFADRLAGAAMMAGHPNETKPDGLRNLAFTLHMGGEDAAYSRNDVARKWRDSLAGLRERDPEGYEHWVEIHEGKGHWMDREDAAALPWLARHTRSTRPRRIVWLQDDVTHPRYYWLAVPTPAARTRIVVERDGPKFRVVESRGIERLTVRLDDSMADLDRPIEVVSEDSVLFSGVVRRTIATLARTLDERGDPRGVYSAEIEVEIPSAVADSGDEESRR